MRVKQVAAWVLLSVSAWTSLLALVYAWMAFSKWRSLSSMTAEERDEVIDICATPGMDCNLDPVVWLKLASIFGVGAIVLAALSRVVAPSRARPDEHR